MKTVITFTAKTAVFVGRLRKRSKYSLVMTFPKEAMKFLDAKHDSILKVYVTVPDIQEALSFGIRIVEKLE